MALNNLTKRILSAIILAPLVLYIIWLGGIAFTLMVVLACIIMLWEWWQITKKAANPWKWMLIGIFYIGLPCFCLIILRYTTQAISCPIGKPCPPEDIGAETTFWLIILVWIVDIAAYAFGKLIGGPKLAPKISPNKTWAGLIGAIVAMLAFAAAGWPVPMSIFLAAAAFAILVQSGDLFESWVKRKFGVKDSGNLIPGHGGLLDRLDGLLFVAPVITVLLYFNSSSIILGPFPL